MATQVANQMAARVQRVAVSAGVPILAAKITAPSVPGWAVPRPRITKLIAQGTRWCPLTVLTAPAGAGKTMALALWTAAQPGTVAWVCLDGYDNRPEVFWSHVVAALRRSGVAVPAVLPPARGRAGDHPFLLGLAATLAAQDPPVTLVLDDLHLLTDPQVLDGLDYVLRNVGPGLRLAVSARMDPLPLHRYRLAGELTEIRVGDLAFTVPEAGQLMARHGITLTADSLERLTRRTEGWAAGLRLAAISMGTHPDPDQFIEELITDDSVLTGYLVAEVLNPQPPVVRELLLSTSILEHVSGEAASELTGNEQAGRILPALARANAFVQPAGSGWYRYHTLFAEVLRLKLDREHPDRAAALCTGGRPSGMGGTASSPTRCGTPPMSATGRSLPASSLTGWRSARSSSRGAAPPWARSSRSCRTAKHGPNLQPHLVSAAVALSAGRHEFSIAALDAADGILERLPANQEAACRLAAALIRLAAARRTGDLAAAAGAAARAEVLANRVPDAKLTRHRKIRARLLSGRGAVELWSGQLDQAARTLESGVTAATAPGGEGEPEDCLGHLALVEALRGRLGRAATLAAQAAAALKTGEPRPPVPHPSPAALVALAWVHLEHNELRKTHSRLEQADAALGVTPDKLIGAVAWLAAAFGGLAQGRAAATAEIVARARSGWSVPAWLEQRLSLVESWAYAAAGDIQAALAAAGRPGRENSPETAVTLARAWVAAGDAENATRALAPVLATDSGAPERVRLQAWLVDAQLGYDRGDRSARPQVSCVRAAAGRT